MNNKIILTLILAIGLLVYYNNSNYYENTEHMSNTEITTIETIINFLKNWINKILPPILTTPTIVTTPTIITTPTIVTTPTIITTPTILTTPTIAQSMIIDDNLPIEEQIYNIIIIFIEIKNIDELFKNIYISNKKEIINVINKTIINMCNNKHQVSDGAIDIYINVQENIIKKWRNNIFEKYPNLSNMKDTQLNKDLVNTMINVFKKINTELIPIIENKLFNYKCSTTTHTQNHPNVIILDEEIVKYESSYNKNKYNKFYLNIYDKINHNLLNKIYLDNKDIIIDQLHKYCLIICENRQYNEPLSLSAIFIYKTIKKILLSKYDNYISDPNFNLKTKEDMINLLNIEFRTNIIPSIESESGLFKL
jgi:hypothetical protein